MAVYLSKPTDASAIESLAFASSSRSKASTESTVEMADLVEEGLEEVGLAVLAFVSIEDLDLEVELFVSMPNLASQPTQSTWRPVLA